MSYFLYTLLGLALLFVLMVARMLLRIRRHDPTMWEFEIRRMEARDRRQPPPPGCIVFTGSSSIRFWTTLRQDMAPLPALNCGFGGAHIDQVTYYAARIVIPYKPRAVVFYAGENDMAAMFATIRQTPQQVQARFREFCAKLHAVFPQLPIYFISIKPPRLRRKHWPAMQEANALIRADCAADPRLHYIDIVPVCLDSAAQTRRELFRWDGIHLNAQGYALWTSVIKPILMRDLRAA